MKKVGLYLSPSDEEGEGMPRFYYTDAFAALWMAKHFRMKLLAGKFCLQQESIETFLRLLAEGLPVEKLLVHPESVGVLEPKIGDVVEDDSRAKVRVLTTAHFPYEANLRQILRRGGRPFIFPEKSEGQ
jgi:hypothetical protein